MQPKTILITGCSSGIGLCAAERLKEHGHRVFATARKTPDVEKLQQRGFESFLLDMNDSNSIHTVITNLLQHTQGRLDVLINNAGYGQSGAIEDLTREALRAQFETNVFGLQELTNLVIPIMRRQGGGRIINISSVLGFVVIPHHGGAYAASKHAVEALSDALRMELHGSGIQVCLIEPGPIDSEFRRKSREAYEKNVDLTQSKHREFYQEWLEKTEQQKKRSSLTRPPEAVVKKIIHAIESKHPKARYYVTSATYFMAIIKRLLPTCCLDKILRLIGKKI